MGLFGDVVKGVEEGIEEAGKIGKKVVKEVSGAAKDVAETAVREAAEIAANPLTVDEKLREGVIAGAGAIATAAAKADKFDAALGRAFQLDEVGEQVFGRTERWKDEITSGEFDVQEEWLSDIGKGIIDPKEDLSFEDFFSFGVNEDEAAKAYAAKGGIALWLADNILYRPSSYVGAGLPGRIATKGGLLVKGFRGGATIERAGSAGRGGRIAKTLDDLLMGAGRNFNKVEMNLDTILAAPIVKPAGLAGKGISKVPLVAPAGRKALAPVRYLMSHAEESIIRMNTDILAAPMRSLLWRNNPGTPETYQQNIARIFADDVDPKQLTPDEHLARQLWNDMATRDDGRFHYKVDDALERIGRTNNEVEAQRIVNETVEDAVRSGFRFKDEVQIMRIREYHAWGGAQPAVNAWKKYISDKVLNPWARLNLRFAFFAPLNLTEDIGFSMLHGTPVGGHSLEDIRNIFSVADMDQEVFSLQQALPVVAANRASLGIYDPNKPLRGRDIIRAAAAGLDPTGLATRLSRTATPEQISAHIRINTQTNATLQSMDGTLRHMARGNENMSRVMDVVDHGPQRSIFHGAKGDSSLQDFVRMHFADGPDAMDTGLTRMIQSQSPVRRDIAAVVSGQWPERPPGVMEYFMAAADNPQKVDEMLERARVFTEESVANEIVMLPDNMIPVLDNYLDDLINRKAGVVDPGGQLEHLEALHRIYANAIGDLRHTYMSRIKSTTPLDEKAKIYEEMDRLLSAHLRENGSRLAKARDALRAQLAEAGFKPSAKVGPYKVNPRRGVTAVKKEANAMVNRIMKQGDVRGGFTYQPIGQKYVEVGSRDGYAVAQRAGGEVFPATQLNQQKLIGFVERHQEAFLERNVYVGAWRDEQNMIHLNITRIIDDKSEAIAKGKAEAQKAIFDIRKGADVKVPKNAPDFSAGDVRDGMQFHLDRLDAEHKIIERGWRQDQELRDSFFKAPDTATVKRDDAFWDSYFRERGEHWARVRNEQKAVEADYGGMSPATYAQRVRMFGAENVRSQADIALARRLAEARAGQLADIRTPTPALLERKMQAYRHVERDVRAVLDQHARRFADERALAWKDEIVKGMRLLDDDVYKAARAGRKAASQHGVRVRDAAHVNYTHKTVGDEIIRNTFSQYWQYQSRRPLRLARLALRYPGMTAAFIHYMSDTEGGYIPIPGSDFQISPARFGITAPARSFQMLGQGMIDYIKTGDSSNLTFSDYDGLRKYIDIGSRISAGVGLSPGGGVGGVGEMLGQEGEFTDLGGMMPSIFQVPGMAAAGGLQLSQYIPAPVRPAWETVLGGYTDTQIGIMDKLGNRYFDYQVGQELLSQGIAPSEATDEQLKEAQRTVMANQLFIEQTGMGKFKPEEMQQIEQEARALALEMGVPPEALNTLRPTNSPISALFADDPKTGEPYLNTAELRRVYEIHPEWRQWSELRDPLKSPTERTASIKRREYYKELETQLAELEKQYVGILDNALNGRAGVTAEDARAAREEFFIKRQQIYATLETLYQEFGIFEGGAEGKKAAEDLAAAKYYAIQPVRDPETGQMDFDSFEQQREAELSKYDPATQDYILNQYRKEMLKDPTLKAFEEVYDKAQVVLEPYWEISDRVFAALKSQMPPSMRQFESYDDFQRKLREMEQRDGVPTGTYDGVPEAKWLAGQISAVREQYRLANPAADLALVSMYGYVAKSEVVANMAGQYGLQVFVNGAIEELGRVGVQNSGLVKPTSTGSVDSFQRILSAGGLSPWEPGAESDEELAAKIERFQAAMSKADAGRATAISDPYGFDMPNRMGQLFPPLPVVEEPTVQIPGIEEILNS